MNQRHNDTIQTQYDYASSFIHTRFLLYGKFPQSIYRSYRIVWFFQYPHTHTDMWLTLTQHIRYTLIGVLRLLHRHISFSEHTKFWNANNRKIVLCAMCVQRALSWTARVLYVRAIANFILDWWSDWKAKFIASWIHVYFFMHKKNEL